LTFEEDEENIKRSIENSVHDRWRRTLVPAHPLSHFVAINHRSLPIERTKDELQKLHELNTTRDLKIHIVGVSINPRLKKEEQDKLKEVNSLLQKTFTPDYIYPLNAEEISADDTEIHYTEDTRKKIWGRILYVIHSKPKN
jgi:hypothetical protein